MAVRWYLIAVFLNLFFLAVNSQDSGADVASAVLGAIFPDLSPETESQNVQKRQFYPGDFYQPRNREPIDYLYNRRAPYPPSYPSYDSYRFSDRYPSYGAPTRQEPVYDPFSSYGFDRYPGPYSPSGTFSGRDTTDYFGLNPYAGTQRMPTMNFPYSAPRFGRISNPRVQAELMDGFPFGSSSGLQGRTDLPPSYVYPFAKPGSVIAPDRLGADVFGLSNNPLPPPRELYDEYLDSMLDPRLFRELLPYLSGDSRYAPRPSRYRPRFWKRGENDTDSTDQPALKQELSDKQWFLPEHQRDIISTENKPPESEASKEKEPMSKLEPKKQKKSKENVRRRPVKKSKNCEQCLEFNITKAVGKWSQVYGNQKSMELVYSSLATLTLPDANLKEVDEFFTPQCVSLKVEPYLRHSTTTSMLPLDLTYSIRGSPHTTKGVIEKEKDDAFATLKFGRNFAMPLCLLKAHEAADGSGYEYLVLAETQGAEECKNVHIFARDRTNFHRLYTNQVGKWIKQETSLNNINSIRLLPNPELCEVPNSIEL